ncbi:STAS domain-containing protein [Pedobacter ginsengisoli]|uniref:STAS domain-containing protein n=1 Tax=Pedobacter ginsengisoli TaxID=363852 RepID=UPI00255065C4|nr:STAS domain-containing protein [Pedobacter ginsengisoli]
MKISKQQSGDIGVIIIEEKEANLSNSDEFKELILEEITSGTRKLIISFKQVEYLDSSFLGALVAILKALLPYNGKLILTDMNDDIVNLFQLTRLDKIFILHNDLENAVKEF